MQFGLAECGGNSSGRLTFFESEGAGLLEFLGQCLDGDDGLVCGARLEFLDPLHHAFICFQTDSVAPIF